MVQLEALTIQLLGRSPYSDVVPGEGEPDPAAPPQEYDLRGRPVNRETRRRNREIIQQSHNEVMLAIGVAENEQASEKAAAEVRAARAEHHKRDDRIAQALIRCTNAAQLVGVWGVAAMRQRALLYRSCSFTPMFDRELGGPLIPPSATPTAYLGGLGSVLMYESIKMPLRHFCPNLSKYRVASFVGTWVNSHVIMFATLQRLGLIKPSWIPWPTFFVPFTSGSLIGSPLPPWGSLTPKTASGWLLDLAISISPLVALHFIKRGMRWAENRIFEEIALVLPVPAPPQRRRVRGSHPPPRPPTPMPTPVPGAAEASTRVQQQQQQQQQQPSQNTQQPPAPQPSASSSTSSPQDSAGASSPSDPPPHDRRSSITHTESHVAHAQSAQDDGATDDETENDVATGVVISFDVESTETPEAASAAPWAAELRATPGGATSSSAATPVYHSTPLTRLLHSVAASTLANWLGTMVSMPAEAVLVRYVARTWCSRVGLGVGGMYGLLEVGRLGTLRGVTNLEGLSFMRMLIGHCVWLALFMAAEGFYLTEEDWRMRR